MEDNAPLEDTTSAPPIAPLNLDDDVAQKVDDTAQPTEPTDGTDNAKTDGTDDNKPTEFNVDDYVANIKVDEGQSYEFNKELLKEVAPVANELGINPEQLSKLANLMAQRESKFLAERQALQAKADEERASRVAEFDKQIAELRKEDPQLASNVKAAMGLDFVKGSAFEECLNTTELGHDPVVFRLLAMAGRTVAVDNGTGANATTQGANGNYSFAEVITGGRYK